MYDFDTPAPRAGSGAIKWDILGGTYGNADALPFWIADSDYRSPPELVEALQDAAARCVFGYNEPTKSYYEAVRGWFSRRHGWDIDTDWILPATGVVSELANVVRCFTRRADKIIIQTPVYDPFGSVIRAAERQVVTNRLSGSASSGYTMDFDDLENKLRDGAAMMILCSPHNPVGRVWTEEEVRRVAQLCRAYGVLLVSDEIHFDIMIGGSRHFTAGLAGTPENIIILSAPSKTFNVAGLKCSNTIIPDPELRQKLLRWRQTMHIETTNNLGIISCETVYTHGDRWCDEQNAYLTENAHVVYDFVRERLPEVPVADLQGTYLMWLCMISANTPSEELVKSMAKAGAVLNDGKRYGDEYYVRLNIACPRSQLCRGLEAMAEGYYATKR